MPLSARPPSLPASTDFEALADKYRTLADLRRRRDADEAQPTRATLRGLASRFPGCLRELDTLGLDELERRAATAALAAGDDRAREAWMDWIWSYHRLLGEALALKQGHEPGGPLPEGFREGIIRPPDGRTAPQVLRAVAAQHGVPARTVALTLFPPRRPWPYTLG